jgi:hypothetical protein
MTPNKFRHAFTPIARATSDIQGTLTTRQIELPNCFSPLRRDVPREIDFFQKRRVFFRLFEPVQLRLHHQGAGEIELES